MIQSRRAFLETATLAVAAAFVVSVPAQAGKVNTADDGLAISGYDPVAYFTDDAAIQGSADFTASHDGANYRFASAANRDAFVANPDKYAPKYGGYCAYAASKGALAPVDPEAFKVVDDRLYLNYSKTVQGIWSEDIPGNIAKADANWPGLSAE